MNDTAASPRHRVDAIRELRACAGSEPPDHRLSERERFTIHINFGGTAKVHKIVELTPRPAEPEPLTIEATGLPVPRKTGLRREPSEDDDYGI
jgi:hypothetical protein